MNSRGGDIEVEGVVGKFRVSGANENGRILIEMCTEKRLTVGNTFFGEKPSISLYGYVESMTVKVYWTLL